MEKVAATAKRAYAYLRVSGKGQVDGDGFPRQSEAIRRHAGGHDLKILATFEEKGVSGSVDGMDRPQWVEMIAQMLAKDVDTIVIEKLDRLARDLMIQEHIIIDLKKRGINLVSVAEPDLCSDDPSRRLMRQIMGAIAEYDRRMIVLKLRGARQRMKAATGRCEGAKPYGTLPGEFNVLGRIEAMQRAGKSLQAIATALNADNVLPRRGVKWHPSSVSSVSSRKKL